MLRAEHGAGSGVSVMDQRLGAWMVCAVAGWFALGCSDEKKAAMSCAPGASVACMCVTGQSGAMTCAASGDGFGACQCESGAGTGGVGGMSGASGASGNGGTSGGGGTAGSGGFVGRDPSMLPTAPSSCPTITEGEVMFGDTKVRVWVGDDGMSLLGPLVIYWHGTCSQPLEAALRGIGSAGIARIKSLGGMVAAIDSPYKSPNNFCPIIAGTEACPGTTTGNGVWCREDYAIADDIVACAIQQVGIDPQRIHTAGMSAGGVMAAAYGFSRSGYLASVTTYSGGGISTIVSPSIQDPNNKYAAMIVHGGPSDGVGAANFQTIAGYYQNELSGSGHFSFICDHGMGHTIPAELGDSTVQFFLDHPFGVTPEPYAGALPTSFPSYCTLP